MDGADSEADRRPRSGVPRRREREAARRPGCGADCRSISGIARRQVGDITCSPAAAIAGFADGAGVEGGGVA
ncbi:hypothetical protein ACGFNU_12190 [Spirillospora sp. NPDC048911]|uniref:hypothetical protein n=1 Tax=Spirillospora sp. NPDC048911 TaxID=3364527 RepID=UPI003714C932